MTCRFEINSAGQLKGLQLNETKNQTTTERDYMVGGKVIETLVVGDKVWINCQEYLQTQDRLLRDKTAIYVENTPAARSVSEGDIVWWQGDRAMWTAKNSHGKTIGRPDTALRRIGFSGVSRPK